MFTQSKTLNTGNKEQSKAFHAQDLAQAGILIIPLLQSAKSIFSRPGAGEQPLTLEPPLFTPVVGSSSPGENIPGQETAAGRVWLHFSTFFFLNTHLPSTGEQS